MAKLKNNERIEILKKRMLEAPRYASIEQARIITRVYKENEELSTPKKRALSLAAALRELEIGVEPEELIGKTLVAITNLPPRKMMGIDSCGMIISAVHSEAGEERLNVLVLDSAIPAGAKLY